MEVERASVYCSSSCWLPLSIDKKKATPVSTVTREGGKLKSLYTLGTSHIKRFLNSLTTNNPFLLFWRLAIHRLGGKKVFQSFLPRRAIDPRPYLNLPIYSTPPAEWTSSRVEMLAPSKTKVEWSLS